LTRRLNHDLLPCCGKEQSIAGLGWDAGLNTCLGACHKVTTDQTFNLFL
jgi:hypothetical protein